MVFGRFYNQAIMFKSKFNALLKKTRQSKNFKSNLAGSEKKREYEKVLKVQTEIVDEEKKDTGNTGTLGIHKGLLITIPSNPLEDDSINPIKERERISGGDKEVLEVHKQKVREEMKEKRESRILNTYDDLSKDDQIKVLNAFYRDLIDSSESMMNNKNSLNKKIENEKIFFKILQGVLRMASLKLLPGEDDEYINMANREKVLENMKGNMLFDCLRSIKRAPQINREIIKESKKKNLPDCLGSIDKAIQNSKEIQDNADEIIERIKKLEPNDMHRFMNAINNNFLIMNKNSQIELSVYQCLIIYCHKLLIGKLNTTEYCIKEEKPPKQLSINYDNLAEISNMCRLVEIHIKMDELTENMDIYSIIYDLSSYFEKIKFSINNSENVSESYSKAEDMLFLSYRIIQFCNNMVPIIKNEKKSLVSNINTKTSLRSSLDRHIAKIEPNEDRLKYDTLINQFLEVFEVSHKKCHEAMISFSGIKKRITKSNTKKEIYLNNTNLLKKIIEKKCSSTNLAEAISEKNADMLEYKTNSILYCMISTIPHTIYAFKIYIMILKNKPKKKIENFEKYVAKNDFSLNDRYLQRIEINIAAYKNFLYSIDMIIEKIMDYTNYLDESLKIKST